MIEIIGAELNQWDVGRSVKVTDVGATHVHFANTGDSQAVIMDAAQAEVKIPDFLLQTGKQLCVYAVANGVTVERKTFPVRKRERPENYVYDEDQRNYIYELIKAAEDAAANNVGRTTAAGGEIFGDYEKNEANAEYAAAFGTKSKAHGKASFVSGTRYPIENDDVGYSADADLDEIVPDDAWRYNEAVGTASTAMGMGNVAFSRASKAFGFRTQTGYPPSAEWLDKRPELIVKELKIEKCGVDGPVGNWLEETLNAVNISRLHIAFSLTGNFRVNEEIGLENCVQFSVLPYNDYGVFSDHINEKITKEGSYEYEFAVPSGSNAIQIRLYPRDLFSGYVLDFKASIFVTENVGQAAVAIGADTAALGNHDIAAGWRSIANGYCSFALGSADSYSETPTEASGYGSVAIGKGVKASGRRSFAIGNGSEASGELSFATGTSKALNTHATAVGVKNTNEGYGGFASGSNNKVEKLSTDGTAAYYGFVANSNNVVQHTASAALGYGNTTSSKYQLMAGVCNSNDAALANAYLKVGCGTSANPKTALAVMSNGNILVGGKSVHSGADYAEFFEWTDGNPDAEDRIGLLVTLEGEKIRLALPGDDVLGIVSGTAAVLGDAAAMYWKDKYLTDEFGRTIYDMVEEFIEVPDPETGEMVKESTGLVPQPRLNPNFDPESTYIPREERKEWDQVGMMGKLYVRDDGTLAAGDYGCPGENGVLAKSGSKTNIRVMKRTGDNIVLVLLK